MLVVLGPFAVGGKSTMQNLGYHFTLNGKKILFLDHKEGLSTLHGESGKLQFFDNPFAVVKDF